MKKIITILAISLVSSLGVTNQNIDVLAIHRALLPSFATGIINLKVGQQLNHNIALMGMEGTMSTKVQSETKVGFWLEQKISIAGMNQKIETHISKEDGSVLEIKINGQKQAPSEPPEMEVQEMNEDNITVPAGTFECTHVKLKNLKSNEMSEVWMNLKLIPINGILKISASQMGMPFTAELTSFKK